MGAACAVEDSEMNNSTALDGDAVPLSESADNLLSAQTQDISEDNLQDLNGSVGLNSGDIEYLENEKYSSDRYVPVGSNTYNVDGTSQILRADPVISGNTFQDIQTAINNAGAGSTIYLDGITYSQTTTNIIQITKSINIIGTAGTVLDAQGRSRIFTITQQASNVNIENITFINGNAQDGGAIFVDGGCSNIGVTNCTFKENTATSTGGAIATQQWYAPSGVTINDCMFIDNSASNGDSVYVYGSNNKITNSSFSGTCNLNASKESLVLTLNLAVDLGNSIKGSIDKSNLSYWDGSSKIPIEITEGTKVNLTNKNITLEIYDEDNVLYDNITGQTDAGGKFTYNYQNVPVAEYTYKAYYMNGDSRVTSEGPLYDIIVTGNTFADIQSAINSAAAGSTLYLKGIEYTQGGTDYININKAITIIGTAGTVLNADGKSRIFNIYQQTNNVNMEGITFLNGNAQNGGAVFVDGGCNNIGITNCTFKDNTATTNGGAIAMADGWTPSGLTVNDCMFIDNSASNANDIYATGSGNQVSDSSFTGKCSLDVAKESQTLIFNLTADLSNSIKGTITKSNLYYWNGTSKIPMEITEETKIKLVDKNVTIEIYDEDNVLYNNATEITDSNGQCTYDYQNLPVEDYTYKAYYKNGDSLVTSEGHLYDNIVTGTTFADIQSAINSASLGSTIYLKGINYTQDGTEFINVNKTITILGTEGTVLDAQGKSRIFNIPSQTSGVNIEGITFVNGNAENGGAIFINGGSRNINVTNCTFKNNTATANGGAISTEQYNGPNGFTIDDCMFIDNSAQNGEDLYVTGDNNQVSDSSFTGKCNLDVAKESQTLILNLTANLGNSIKGTIAKNNLNYWNGTSKIPVEITNETKVNLADKNITIEIYDEHGNLIDNVSGLTDGNGQFTYDYHNIPVGEYTYKATYMDGDSPITSEGYLYNIVIGDTFTDIENAINASEAGSTLYLKGITYTNDMNRNIVINKPITIVGMEDTVLDAEDKSGIFAINDRIQNVSIENVTFINGNAHDGGAVNIGGDCKNIDITNCTFENNTATRNGGAIAAGYGATPVINNCLFVDNSAQNGDAVYCPSENAIISNSAFTGTCDLDVTKGSNTLIFNLSVDLGSSIAGNIAKDNLSYWDGSSRIPIDMSQGTKISLADQNITLNIYDENGDLYRGPITCVTDNDGLYTYDYNDIPFGEYTYNATYMDGDSPITREGYLYNIVDGNNFTAIQKAIDEAAPGSTIYLKGITYDNDKDSAIVIDKPITIIGTEGTVLNAEGDSGIFTINQQVHNVTIENITFVNGSAQNGGAIFIGNGCKNITISDCNFKNNTASNDGGAIAADWGGSPIINNCIFEDNSADGSGQAIYCNGDNSTVSNSSFKQKNDLYVSGGNSILTVTLSTDYRDAISGSIDQDNLSYWDGSSYKPSEKPPQISIVNQPVTIEIYDNETGQLIDNVTYNTDENGQVNYNYTNLPFGEYTYKTYTFYGDSKIEEEGLLYTIVSGDKFSDIQRTIDSVTPGTTVYLRNITYTNDIGKMLIDRPITIIGTEGTVLDAEEKSRIFDINSYNVKLANIEFVNGSEEDGGAIYISDNSNNIEITNSSFSNNTAANDGGAVYIAGSTYAIKFTDVNFTDNIAGRGGGAIKSTSNGNDLTLENCSFVRNEATGYPGDTNHEFGGGGLWCYNGVTYLTNCTFDSNRGDYGGAVRGAVGIRDSLFENNVAFCGNGGAIDMTIEGSVKPELYIEDTKFINNTAKDNFPDDHVYTDADAVSQGGAVHIYDIDKVEMYGCELYNNTAKYRGGGLDFYILREGYVENCTFENNTAIVAGGAYIWGDPKKLTDFKCNFTNVSANYNSARDEAGAFYIKGDNVRFHDVTSNYNNASIGGSTYIEGNNTHIHDCTFDNNLALYNGSFDESGIGGAIYVLGNHAQLWNVTSENNVANRGGSTFIRGNDITVKDSKFDNNNATYNGGALNIGGDNVNITNISASQNTADNSGGAVFVDGNHVTFDMVNSTNNTAFQGGSFYVDGDDTTVKNSLISNNTAIASGGGVFINGDHCKIINNNITFNNAVDPTGSAVTAGGGLAIQSESATVNITNNNISSNHATDNGGGVYITDGEGSVIMDQIYAYNNTAENGGFCGVILCPELIVTDSTFESNHATGDIFGQPDRGEGGAFNLFFVFDASIQGNFYNNTAMNGSAIYSTYSELYVHDSEFIDNQAHSYYLIVVPKDNKTYQLGEDVDVTISHIGGDNVINAIHMTDDDNYAITLRNVTYPFYNNGKFENRTTPIDEDVTPVLGYENSNDGEKLYLDDLEDNQVIYYKVINETGAVWAEGSDITDISGTIRFTLENLPIGNYRILATYDETTYYTEIDDDGSFRIVGPGLTVEKISVTPVVYVGEQTVFTIVVTNAGNTSLGSVYVIENVPAGLTYAGYANGTGRWNVEKINDTTYNFTLVGNLAKDENASFNVIFNTSVNGTFTNVVVAGSNVTNETSANNNTTVLNPSMTVEKITLNKTVYLGEQTAFTVIVNNTGDCSLGSVYVIENVPAGLTYAGYANGTGRWNVEKINDTTYNFTLVGNLAKDGDASFNVIFNTTIVGNFTNVVVAGSNVTNETRANNNTTVKGISINVTKVWNDSDDQDGVRPDNVTVVLMAGNDEVNTTVLSESNNWTDVFSNLPVYKDGVAIVYSIKELSVSGYTVVVGDIVGGKVNITNTHIPETTEINVTKVWNDSDDYDGIRPEYVTVYLLANGLKVNETNLSADNGWKHTFINLPVNKEGSAINYTIREIAVEGYNTTINYNSSEITIVNSHIRPDMTVEKLSLNETVIVGEIVYFDIVVTNTGNCNLTDVKVSEIYNSNELRLEGFTGANWTRNGDVFTYNGVLAKGANDTFTVWFTTLVNGTLINTVNATSNETDNKTANNNTTAVFCDLKVTKLVNASNVYVNDSVEWTIIVVNNGPANAKDVIVNDTLPNNIVIESCSHNYEQDGNNIIWKLGELEPNDPITITLVTKLLEVGKYDNIVVVNTSTKESSYDNNKANNTTFANPICDLMINKTVNASRVYVNDTVEWTITVINVGPSTAANVKVKDTLPEGTIITYYDDSSAGHFNNETRIWEIGELNVNEPVSLILVTKILTEGNKTNFVVVNTTTAESNNTNNKANNTTVADPICDLIINKTVNASSIRVGDSVEWTITVVNVGPSTASNVNVTDILPEGVIITEYDDSAAGSFNNETRIWEIGELNVNEPVSLILVTKVLTEGNITNIVVVNTTTYEPNKTNNEANNTTVANPICDLEINKYVSSDIVPINDSVVWTIEVINHGPSVAKNVVVNDTLPQGLVLIDAKPSIGNYSDGIWTIGDLDVNTPVSLQLTTQVTKAGNITNIAVVNTTTNETDKSNNIANNTTEVQVCDLEIIKLVSSKKSFVGEELTWTIIVINHGPSEASDVEVLEDIPSSLRLIGAVPSKGTYNWNNNIWSIGKLERESRETLVIITEVLSVGNITNPVEVSTSTPDSNKTNNKANNTTEAFPIVDLVVKKSSDKDQYHVNDTIHWTITVFNRGPCDAHDVLAIDVLPSGVEFVSYNASKGSYDVETGKWTIGDLANGESVTMDLYCVALKEGIITNEVNVTCNETDSNLLNNYDNSTVEVINETPVTPSPEEPIEPVRMLATGNPIAYLIVVIMIVFGSFWIKNRKE